MSNFAIMTVCSGNICRSPVAEQVLREKLAGLPVTLESAGTIADDGAVMPDQAQAISEGLGGDPSQHKSRYLRELMLSKIDLAFGMAREHRRDVVKMSPRLNKKAFTIREFARLTDSVNPEELREHLNGVSTDPVERMRESVAYLTQRRGMVLAPEDPTDDDVVDPYRRADEVYVESGRQLGPAIDKVAAYLRFSAIDF